MRICWTPVDQAATSCSLSACFLPCNGRGSGVGQGHSSRPCRQLMQQCVHGLSRVLRKGSGSAGLTGRPDVGLQCSRKLALGAADTASLRLTAERLLLTHRTTHAQVPVRGRARLPGVQEVVQLAARRCELGQHARRVEVLAQRRLARTHGLSGHALPGLAACGRPSAALPHQGQPVGQAEQLC